MLVASVLILIALPANGHVCGDTQCVSCSKGNPEYRRHGHHYHPKYFIGKNGVYFGNMPVEGASKSGFKVLSDGYAMDSWNVYYCGRKLEYVAVNSFKVLGCGYAKDNWNVYYNGTKIAALRPCRLWCFLIGMPRTTGTYILTVSELTVRARGRSNIWATVMARTTGTRTIWAVNWSDSPICQIYSSGN